MKKLVRLVLVLFGIYLSLPQLNAQVSVSETHINNVCSGGTSGSINITVTGGTSPYSYLWNDGILTEDRNNIAAGTYNVTVTDFSGSTAALSINISQGPAIAVSKNITPVTCGGGNDGAINLSITGGAPGYTYLWADGITSEDRINVTAANYYFTVTDALGCTKSDSANVTQPMGIVPSAVINNANCNANNGHIDLTVQYGYPPYSYLWNDGFTTQDRVSLMIGTYTVTITDSINCSVSLSATINQDNNNMNFNNVKVSPSCFGGNNGSITISHVTGGVGPFTYLWNNGSTSASNTGLSAGNYNVTVTSSTGCVEVKSYTLTQPTQLNTSLNVIPLTCYGINNGAIVASSTGGSSPYFYSWNDGAFTSTRLGLSAGTYNVTVSDSKGCSVTASGTVGQPLQLNVTATPNPLSCIGGPTGSVTTSVTGGTVPYSYWWGAGITTPHRTNVNSGTYSVTVTDANGCSVSGSATIPSYTPLASNTAQVVNVSCNGGNNGAINITTLNGAGPYSFNWNTGQTTEDLNNLSAGTYTITITDNNGCTTSRTVNISQPSFPVSISSTIVDANCFGSSDGAITLTINNGTGPYAFNWSDGATTQNRTNITGGNYSVTVTDNSSCSATGSYTVAQPTQMVIYSVDTNVTCFGGNDGIVHPYITGGFAPYSYTWNVGGNTQVKTNLTAGTYTVTATDTRNCSVSLTSVIAQPAQVFVAANASNVTCNGLNNGTINISVSGAPAPLSFSWNDGILTQNRSNLAPGSYTVSVTDNNGCINTASAVISQPAALVVNETHTDAGCSGSGTGSATLTVAGGTSPYNFNWSNGAVTQNISNITSGNYAATISDANSCSASISVAVGQVPPVSASATHTNASCAAGNNGIITVSVTSGTSPYNFVWNDNIVTQNRTSLTAGVYSVTVTDANNCSAVTGATISEPAALALSYTTQDATCYNSANGSIDLSVSGGTGNYLYSWSNNQQTQDIQSLQAGNYFVNVTDANNCISSTTVTITQPVAVSVTTNATPATCYSSSTASIAASAAGGTGSYQYNWSNGTTNATANSIAAGTYVVTATDVNGCSASASATVGQASPITITETITNVACYNDNHGSISVSVSGGTGNYSYLWNTGSNSSNIVNLTAATYTVTVTDANGCTATKNITITQPTAIQLTTSATNANCYGTSSGSINLAVSGGTGSYQYVWNTGAQSQNLQNIPAGTYDVVVTDNNSCVATASVTINHASAIQIALNATDVSCNGGANGTITTTVSGGSPLNGTTYFYQWSNNQSSQSLSGLTANTYSVVVSDAANCSATASIAVQQPSAIQVTETHSDIECYGNNTGSIDVTVTGGTGSYTYLWSNNATTQDIQNLVANSYTVTVKDANNCPAQKTISVAQPTQVTISETHTDYACAITPGSISIVVTGGSSPYNFVWNDGSNSASRTQLQAGNYMLTATDSRNCTATTAVNIAAVAPLSTTINKQDVTCHATSTGFIDLTVSGGKTPYSYVWNTGVQTQDLQNITAGTYNVLVKDANNCEAQNSITITQPAAIIATTAITHVTCYGQLTGVADLTVTGGAAPYNYMWSNGKTTQDLTGVAAGTYSVTISDAASCNMVTGNITITQPQQINATSAITSESCHGNDGAIALSVNGGSAPYTYTWSNASVSSNLTGVQAGAYTTTVTDSKGCVTIRNYTIPLDAAMDLHPVVQNTPCPEVNNGAVHLNVTGGSPAYNFNWSNGETTASVQQLPQGIYTVTVTDAKNCTAVETFSITYNYILEVNAGEDKTIVAGQYLSLSATTNVDHGNMFNWTPAESIQCADCANTTANPPSTTQFVIEVTDANGCHAVDSVLVSVQEITPLYIPNAFTPNGDGNNDVFQAYGDDASIHYFELMVFNRWGEKVFESNNLRETWDGTYQGEASPNAVYVYIAKAVYLDGSKNDYKGSVTLIR